MLLAPDDLIPEGPARWSPEAVSAAWQACRRQLREALADPSVHQVVILVGVPGCGKSTWARDHDHPSLVIFDACWTDPGKRRALAAQIRAAHKVPIAIWVRTPFEICRERNAARPPGRRVPDAAVLRAAVALKAQPPTVAEGWAYVLEQDGQAERIHDAKLTPEQQLERAAHVPAKTAWKVLRSKILPALAKAEPGAGVPADVEKHLAALDKALAKGAAKTAIDITKIGERIDERERAEWDKIVTKALGSPWETHPNEKLVAGWAERNAASVNKIAAGIVPGLRAAIEEARAKGTSADELAKAWGEGGLPLAGFGTAEGRARALAKGSAAELASDATRAAQEALDCDQYEWGPTTSKNPDPEHAERRGKRFRWSEPPPDGHPGTRHGCHCTAKPVITLAEAKDLKASLGLEEPKPAPAPAPKPATPPPAPSKPAPAPKAKPKPAPKAEPGGWKPLPVPDLPKPKAPEAPKPAPAPAPKAKPKAPAKPKPAPAAHEPAPTTPPPPPPKSKGPMVPDPPSWLVARELEAKAMAELTPAKRKKLQELIARDQPVHDPQGVRVGTEGSSAAAKAWGKKLTKKQREAIVDWSESGYSRMRAVDGGIGRDLDLEMSGERYLKTREQLVELREAMRAAPKHEGEIYRGLTIPLNVPSAKAYHDMITTEGNEFKLESLSSWSHNKSVSRNQFSSDVPGGLLVRITKSTRGVPINAEGLSSFGDDEGEILIDKGSRYRVVRVTRDKGDQHRLLVDLEEI